MLFQDFSENTRIWIYNAARKLSEQETQWLQERGAAFTASWASHGAALKAEITILNNIQLVIAVDEQIEAPSGCSIDKSMEFVHLAENRFDTSFTNRMLFVYECNTGKVCVDNLNLIEELFAAGKINNDTVIFDQLVQTLSDFRSRYQVPLKDSWVARFAPQSA
jgi:hypothetical protein